jgi:hypothetical protein
MGASIGAVTSMPDVEDFKNIVTKIDKLRTAGFTMEEIHSILSAHTTSNSGRRLSTLIPLKTGQGKLINLKALSGQVDVKEGKIKLHSCNFYQTLHYNREEAKQVE